MIWDCCEKLKAGDFQRNCIHTISPTKASSRPAFRRRYQSALMGKLLRVMNDDNKSRGRIWQLKDFFPFSFYFCLINPPGKKEATIKTDYPHFPSWFKQIRNPLKDCHTEESTECVLVNIDICKFGFHLRSLSIIPFQATDYCRTSDYLLSSSPSSYPFEWDFGIHF